LPAGGLTLSLSRRVLPMPPVPASPEHNLFFMRECMYENTNKHDKCKQQELDLSLSSFVHSINKNIIQCLVSHKTKLLDCIKM
jgi:hypothetical protein